MNKEEILAAARKQGKGMDEYQKKWYLLAYTISAGVSIILSSILQIYELLREGNWFEYSSIIMIQFCIVGFIFGIKNKKTLLGIIYLIGGIVCLLAGVFQLYLFFIRG